MLTRRASSSRSTALRTTTEPVWRFEPSPKTPGLKLTPFQGWLTRRRERNLVAVAARRSGKTVGVRALILATCLGSPNGMVGYIGPTQGQAKRLIWRALMRDVRQPGAEHFVDERKINRSELTIEFRNGCVFSVFGAHRPETIRGSGYDLIVADEADDPTFTPDIFEVILPPALSDRGTGRLVQVGSPKGRGRLYEAFKRGQPGPLRDPETASIQVTAVQAGLIPQVEIERARRLRTPRAFRQEYEASFEAPAGIVYDEWDPRYHIAASDAQLPPRWDEIVVGVDWGSGNRGVMLVIGIDYVRVDDGFDEPEVLPRAWVIEEHAHAGMGYDDGGWWRIARDIQRAYQPSVWYADPAGGSEGYLRQLRNALKPGGRAAVEAADNAVGPGISTVREFVHTADLYGTGRLEPRLYVTPQCEHLRDGFGSYRYRAHRTRAEEFTDEPVKENDHELDALRYALHTHFSAVSKKRRELSDSHHGWG